MTMNNRVMVMVYMLKWLLASALACALSACGNAEPPAVAPASAKQTIGAPTKPAPANNSPGAQIKLQPTNAGMPLAELRFELSARPEPGKPVAVQLSILGLSEVTDLQLALQSDNIEITQGAQATFAALKVGETLTHGFSVLSLNAGIFVVDLQLKGQAEGRAQTTSYSLPVAFIAAPAKAAG